MKHPDDPTLRVSREIYKKYSANRLWKNGDADIENKMMGHTKGVSDELKK